MAFDRIFLVSTILGLFIFFCNAITQLNLFLTIRVLFFNSQSLWQVLSQYRIRFEFLQSLALFWYVDVLISRLCTPNLLWFLVCISWPTVLLSWLCLVRCLTSFTNAGIYVAWFLHLQWVRDGLECDMIIDGSVVLRRSPWNRTCWLLTDRAATFIVRNLLNRHLLTSLIFGKLVTIIDKLGRATGGVLCMRNILLVKIFSL